MVRLATREDYPIIHRMGERFVSESGNIDICEYDPKSTEKTLDILVNQGTLFTDGEYGMIGFLVFPMYTNHSCLIAQELFWWVDEDKRSTGLGIKLLKAAEKKAKELGAGKMLMLCVDALDGDRVEKLYLKLGYSPRERTFARSL